MFWVVAALVVIVFLVVVVGAGGSSESTESEVRRDTVESPDYRERLKQATEKKRAGDLDGAADLIGEVISEWEDNPPTHPNDAAPEGVVPGYPEAKVYTRWALYLQRADRPEEAERIFRMLIAGEYPECQFQEDYYRQFEPRFPEDEYTKETGFSRYRCRELTHVYNKYRLFLQREGREDDAVLPIVLGMGADMVGLHLAAQESDQAKLNLEHTDLQKDVSETVAEATEGTAFEDRAGELEAVLSEWVARLPDTDLETLEGQVRTALESG